MHLGCDCVTTLHMEKIAKCLQSYIPPEYDSVKDNIEKMKFQKSSWVNEITIFATTQLSGKDVVTFLHVQWKQLCASWTF